MFKRKNRQPSGGIGSNQYKTVGSSRRAERDAAAAADRWHPSRGRDPYTGSAPARGRQPARPVVAESTPGRGWRIGSGREAARP